MIDQLKLEIKNLELIQKDCKNQRKTINFVGTRTMSAGVAQSNTEANRFKLRHLYIAYGLLRGKTLDQIESNRKSEPNQRFIDKIMEKYKLVEV